MKITVILMTWQNYAAAETGNTAFACMTVYIQVWGKRLHTLPSHSASGEPQCLHWETLTNKEQISRPHIAVQAYARHNPSSLHRPRDRLTEDVRYLLHRHRDRLTDDVFQQQVPANDEGHQFPYCHIAVHIGWPSTWDSGGKLCITHTWKTKQKFYN